MLPKDIIEKIEFSKPHQIQQLDHRQPYCRSNYYTTLTCENVPASEISGILLDPASYPLYLTLKRGEEPINDEDEVKPTPAKRPKTEVINLLDDSESANDVNESPLEMDDIRARLPDKMIAVKDIKKVRFQEHEFVETPYGLGKIISWRIDRYATAKVGSKPMGNTVDSSGVVSAEFNHCVPACEPTIMYSIDLNFGTCHIPSYEVKPMHRTAPYNDFDGYASHKKECYWKRDVTSLLNNIDQKGDFCVMKNVSDKMQFLSPLICVAGMTERLALPLVKSQILELQSISQRLSESGHSAPGEINASAISFQDKKKWQAIVQDIAKDCASALGVGRRQQKYLVANFSKMRILQPGNATNQQTGNNENGLIGTLIIQLPSSHTGGFINVGFGDEVKEFDLSEFCGNKVYATALYADCYYQFAPVGEGCKFCLEYDLLLSINDAVPGVLALPSASALTHRMQHLQALTSSWNDDFKHIHGYLLYHDYKGRSLQGDLLKFANLAGRDRGVVDVLRGCRDKDGNPSMSVCLILLQDACYDSDDCEQSNHGRVEPDDENMARIDLDFDIGRHLLASKVTISSVFDRHKALKETWYDDDDGQRQNEYQFRAAVVFWPKSKDAEIMTSMNNTGMLTSYSEGASKKAVFELGRQVIQMLKDKRRPMTAEMLSLLRKTKSERLIARALMLCTRIADDEFASLLVEIRQSTESEEIKVEILELVKRTSAARMLGEESDTCNFRRRKRKDKHLRKKSTTNMTDAINLNYLRLSYLFLCGLKDDDPFASDARKYLVSGAVRNIKDIMQKPETIFALLNVALKTKDDTLDVLCDALVSGVAMNGEDVMRRPQIIFALLTVTLKSSGNFFRVLCDGLKADRPDGGNRIVVQCLIRMGDKVSKNPHVVRLAKVRLNSLKGRIEKGPPSSALKYAQPGASYRVHKYHEGEETGEEDKVNAFLRGADKETEFKFCYFRTVYVTREWVSNFNHRQKEGCYRGNAAEKGCGKGSSVIVTKSISIYKSKILEFEEVKKEYDNLIEMFGVEVLE